VKAGYSPQYQDYRLRFEQKLESESESGG
jgi:hypothetical protein